MGKVRSAMCGQGIGVCLCLTLLIFALPSFSQPSVDTLRCAPPRDVRWADAACGYGSGSGSVASNDSTSGRAADEWRGWTAGGADAGVPHDSLGHRRPKVAVVLSGGGAKGMAHIGALRVIERAGLPIDIITGTSMGALIGGLYSIGYDAETLDSLVGVQDWKFLLSDRVKAKNPNLSEREKQNTYILSMPLTIARKANNMSGGLINGNNLSQLFTRLTIGWHDSIDFADLPIPFACVASNIVDNTEYDFLGGNLSTAMRASMAIPGVFTPVRLKRQADGQASIQDDKKPAGDVRSDGKPADNGVQLADPSLVSTPAGDEMVLVDGGMRNNYPVDLARRLGADIVIGVSVQSAPRTSADLKSAQDILLQIVDINCKNKFEENWAMTDIPIRVNVKGYSSASFNREAIDTLIVRGEQAAMQQWDKLMALKRSLGLPEGYAAPHAHRTVPSSDSLLFKVDTVLFDGIAEVDRDYIVGKYGISHGNVVSAAVIEQAISALYEDFLYTDIKYNVNKQADGYVLRLSAGARRTSRVNLGVRFDTEEMVALQANISHRLNTKLPVELEFTGRLGKRMMARLDAGISPLHYGKMGLSYIFRHDDINIYENGRRGYNFTYNQHSLDFQVASFNIRNFSCDINLCMDFYDFHNILIGEAAGQSQLDNVHFYSYVFNLNYDSEDRWFFTTRGAKFKVGFGYHTDNFISWHGKAGISVVDFMWRMSFPLNTRLVIQPMFYGRCLLGSDIPLIMRNAVGGMFPGQYIEQQLPFAGIGHIEFIDNTLLAFQLKGQQRIADNNYVMARLSLGQRSGRVRRLFDNGPMFGCEAAYYYNSMFGPIGASLGYSGHTERPYFYVSLGFHF